MTTTGIFTVHRHTISFDKLSEPVYLVPFGDIHRSSPMCDVKRWEEFTKWAKGKPRCYFIGMGDYDDLTSTTERDVLRRGLHESTVQTLEQLYASCTDRLAGELAFMKGKLIGLLEGNHYAEFQNGTTSTQRLCDKLECKYLGVSSFVRLAFRWTKPEKRGDDGGFASIDIWAHHGRGAARLTGGSLNRVEQMLEGADASVYLMGHDHKKSAGMKTRMHLVGGGQDVKLAHRKILFARTGTFLKGYEPEKASYIADGAYNPTDMGVIKIELTPKIEHDGIKQHRMVDIHVSI